MKQDQYWFLFYLGRSRRVKEICLTGRFLKGFIAVSLVIIVLGSFCWGWQKELQSEISSLEKKNQTLTHQKEKISVLLQEEYELFKDIHKKMSPLYTIVVGVDLEDLPERSFVGGKQFEQSVFLSKDMDSLEKKMSLILNAIVNRKELLQKIPHGWPLVPSVSKRIVSGYGKRFSPFSKDYKMHTGVDLPAPPDAEIFSTGEGIVHFSGYKKSYGYTVMVDHRNGFSTLYAHCAQLLVHEGERIRKGQPIALVGISGDTTGFHLHYEVRIDQKAVDPGPFLMMDP